MRSMVGQKDVTLDGKMKCTATSAPPRTWPPYWPTTARASACSARNSSIWPAEDYPTEEAQFRAYKQVAEAMKGKRVIIRTLDIGADKQVDYFHLNKEENPAMGLRAIRICLNRPEVFRTQLRALLPGQRLWERLPSCSP